MRAHIDCPGWKACVFSLLCPAGASARRKSAKVEGSSVLSMCKCILTLSQPTHLFTSYIPEGTVARIHFWSVHRDERNFSFADTFWPDRWLIAEGLQEHPEAVTHNPNAWIPFSFGPSNCVGKNLAMQEIRMMLCYLVQRLDMKFPEGYDPVQYEQGLDDRFVFTIGRLPVIVQRRTH